MIKYEEWTYDLRGRDFLLRIIHLAPPLRVPPEGYGGTERVIYYLAREQARRGHEVTVVAGPGSFVQGCQTVCYSSAMRYGRGWFQTKVSGFVHAVRVFEHSFGQADVLHNHVAEEGTALSFLSRPPCLTTLQGQVHYKLGPVAVTRLTSLTKKTKLVAVSRSSFLGFRRFFGKDILGFVHNGIDPADYPYVDIPRRCHEVEAVFAARLSFEKGPHLALKVMDILEQKGYKVHLKIFAPALKNPTHYQETLLNEARRRNYTTLHLGAPKGDLLWHFGNSDFLLFPILWEEPFGVATIEAQACGTPVLAFPRGALPEIVNHGRDGFLCESVEEMAECAEKISQIRREECVANVRTRFSAEALYQHYEEYYQKILS